MCLKIPTVFHNGSNYDYHFIIKNNLKFKILNFKIWIQKTITCLGENTEKYITFTVPIEKEVTRIDKNGEEITKNISYILQFIDSGGFMVSSLSNLVNNLSEGIHKIKCKFWHNYKNLKHAELSISIATAFLNTQILKMI